VKGLGFEMKKRKVVVVDDHAAVRVGIRVLLERTGRYEVVAERETAHRLDLLVGSQPGVDAVIVDFTLADGGDVPDEIRRVGERCPGVGILVFSGFEDPQRVQAAVRAGADGYMPKSAAPSMLLEALDAICAGDAYLHPRVQRALMDLAVAGDDERSPSVGDLSPREREVLDALGRGLENREIAQEIGVSVGAVKTYLSRLCRKLGLTRRTQAALYGAVGKEPAKTRSMRLR
jgi:two-component system response regulator DevR